MHRISILLFGLLGLYLGLIFYSNRTIFTSRFDADYWKDKYEHSQWKLPLSERTIGDDGLYMYEGYRIIRGDDPTTLNAEVPPLAKYLIGASILVLGNGYIYGFIITTLALVVVFTLTYILTGTILTSTLATILVALDPLIAKQFSLTMLDSLQLLFLLVCLLCITAALKIKHAGTQALLVAASGLSLGFFAEVKFPLFTPVVALIIVVALLQTKNWLRLTLVFLTSTIISYLIPYIPYFLMGHSFREWLGVQKWIIMFFLQSGLKPTYGSMATTLLFDRNQDLFTRTFELVPEWSPAWPVITILGIIGLIKIRRLGNKKLLFFPVVSTLICLLLFNSLIPFWTRYLVNVLPFLYIGATILLMNMHPGIGRVLFTLLISVNMIAVTPIIFPTPRETATQFFSDWEHGFFQDMYERTTEGNKIAINRGEFHRSGRTIWHDAQIESAEIQIDPYKWRTFVSPQYIPVTITYKTRNLGTFIEHSTIPFIREHGQWRAQWSWAHLIADLESTSVAETTVIPAKRGGLYAKNGTPLAIDQESLLIWLDPDLIVQETERQLFDTLEILFEKKIKAVHFHERYVRLADIHKPIPMGVVMTPLTPETQTKLKQFPAIRTTTAWGRFTTLHDTYIIGAVSNTLYVECCSLLYTTTSYDGADGVEKEYNDTLKGENGGSLVLKDASGNIKRIIIITSKRDGENVRLPY